MMDTEVETTVKAGNFVGKLFPTASGQLGGPGGVAWEWRFGLLRRIYPYVLFACDLVLITAIYSLTVFLRQGEWAVQIVSKQVLLMLAVTCVFGVYLIGGYSFSTKGNSARFVSEHLIVSIFAGITVLSIIYGFISFGTIISAARGPVLATLVAFPLASILYRYRLEGVKARRRSKRAICILGASARSLDLVKSIRREGHGEEIFVFDERMGSGPGSNEAEPRVLRELGARMLPLGDYDPVADAIKGFRIDTIILAMRLEEMSEETVKRLIYSHSVRNQVVTLESYVLKTFKYVPIHKVSPSWTFGEGFRINSSLVYNRAKRMIDFTGALFGLLLAAPFLLGTALAVKLTSRGTVLFRQERIGRLGEPFTLYKFRTMVEGADKLGDYTAEKDLRITSIGNFLRKSRLDEIPQLLNVLKGEMSLVGPRPEWSKLVEDYEGKVEFYHYRHLVRPGITGWAQVCYPYGASVEDALQKFKYDLFYVRYYSLVLDITIVVKTAYTMIFGRGR